MINTRRNKVTALFAVLLTFLSGGFSYAQDASVLASGVWYKLAVTQPGIYQITGEDLQKQGIDLSLVQPDQIQIFGHGGGMLPQALDHRYWPDPPENAIQVVGGEEGSFDLQDYILFYGQSPDEIGYSNGENGYVLSYQKNLYSDTAFYFFTFGQQTGKRIPTIENVKSVSHTITAFDDYATHEQDLTNILAAKIRTGSGREWYGEILNSGESIKLDFDTPGLAPNTEIQLWVNVLGTSYSKSEFDVFLNSQRVGKINVEPLLEGTYNEKGKAVSAFFKANSNEIKGAENMSVRLTYQSGGSAREAYLNKIVLNYERKLALSHDQTIFRNLTSVQYPASAFQISTSTGNVQVWDITDPQIPKNQPFVYQNATVEFGAATQGQLREFAIFKNQNFLKPAWLETVPNQNLKDGEVPDLVIVSYPAFVSEAGRLAQFRREHDRLNVRVVTTQQVYNEFSSGAQDVTAIRNYLKYLYDQQQGRLKHVLLFGKCSYDFKDRVDRNTNFVPSYQSRNSTHPIYSYSSDDYYGFLEDDEGFWDESFAGDHTLDIGVGRLPVKSLQEAKAVVDKLLYYSTNPSTLGDWKNQVIFVADDGDGNKHQQDADQLATQVDTSYAIFNTNKIYTDVYPQESMPAGAKAPKVSEAIQDAIKKGAFIINYTGHGNEKQWAHENILTTEMINQWRNIDKLPFFVTATCEFGRHDDPKTISGAEQLVLNPKGGAIGMVTTARPVFSSSNFLINKAFYTQVFRQVNGQYQTLGEIFKNTKNAGLNGRVNRNFSLLGDPSMHLAYPKDQIIIDSVLAMDTQGEFVLSDTLMALSRIKLKGRVVQRESQKVNLSFNGTLFLSVYDKPTQMATRGSDGPVMQFEERKSVIHRGKASIQNGSFELELVIPKNIVYKNGGGKISMYAVDLKGNERDAHGSNVDVQIGGSISPLPADQQAPTISLYMDDTTFVNGGITASNTMLLAFISDENGINISNNGLGQHIQAILERKGDVSEIRTFLLNDFFVTEMDTYQKGVLSYPIENLEDGKYVLTLQAWDNANNKSENFIEFFVQSRDDFTVNSFYNIPNPFNRQTSFVIDHNRQGDHLKVIIRIINLQGKLVHGFDKNYTSAPTRIQDAYWDGTNTEGQPLTPGIYLARLILQSQTDGAQKEKVQKIIIVN